MASCAQLRVSPTRQLRIHIVRFMALLLFARLADLPCSDSFLVSDHRASAAALGPPSSRRLDWEQYHDNIRHIGGRIAPGSRGDGVLVAAAAKVGLAGHPKRELSNTRRARGRHTLKVSSYSNSTGAPPDVEVRALAGFKAAITSDPSGALRSWIVGAAANESDACSRWVGVTCSPQFPNHVLALELSNLQLVGRLDSLLPKLVDLQFLQSVDLSGNLFSGSMQGESFTNLSHLSHVNMSYNQVTGEIPLEMGELVSLQDLDVSGNNMTGPIPESLRNCSLLRSIYVGDNALEGDIPAWLGTLSSLEYLNVSYNSLSGSIPSALGNCSSLRLLDLDNLVNLGGSLPQELSLLTRLQVFHAEVTDISGAFPIWIVNLTLLSTFNFLGNLEGEIPDTIGRLEFLEDFSLGNNEMGGVIPLSICNLTSLQVFQLENTNITGPIPPKIGLLTNLFWLNLGQNLITGVIPSSLANCSALSVLLLGENETMDPQPIPSWLGSLTNLTFLYLSIMNLYGEVPESIIGGLFNLQSFDAAGNKLTGKIPVTLRNCTYLQSVDFGTNQMTGTIPPELGELTYMFHFSVAFNQLTGSFPEFISNWTQLSFLSIQGNYLSGPLDGRMKIDQLGQLTVLNVAGNNFDGPIPEATGNSTSINILYMNTNLLSGPIPSSLGNLTDLQQLALFMNNLQGPIPISLLVAGSQLSYLALSDNQLQGTLPSEIGQLVQLTSLYLEDNNFTGTVPDSLGNCTKVNLLDLSNNQFEGNIPAIAISKMYSSLTTLVLSLNHFVGSWPREFTQLSLIQYIDVSCNNISGPIPVGLGLCVNLNYLDVSNNSLTGQIPQDLGSLAQLQFFNASFNDFTGPIPHSGIFNSNRINGSSFLGNPGLCGPIGTTGLHYQKCAVIPVNVSNSHHHHCKGFSCKQVWIPVAVVSALILLAAILITWGIKSRHSFNRSGSHVDFEEQFGEFGAQIRFTEKGIMRTIDTPNGDNVIGVGARSIVYKGTLPGGQIFALKKLLPSNNFQVHTNDSSSNSKDVAPSELAKEARILANLRHKNILKCLSFYSSLDLKVLILEYMSGGSLHKHLHEVEPCELTWQIRLKVAMGVAEGMKYLHHDFPEPVIHRDLKPSNIFLDEEFEPKVGDFGISKFVSAQSDQEATASTFCGTIGYMPPEYASQAWVSVKGDVYSYGIVVIELLTLMQPSSLPPVEDQDKDLRSLVLSHFQEGTFDLLDPYLMKECSNPDSVAKEQMLLLLKVSLFCTRADPQSRPSMINVVGMLIYIINLGVEPARRRTIEDLANDVDPTAWVSQNPAIEDAELDSNC